MAKKKLNWRDLNSNQPDWAVREREAYQKKTGAALEERRRGEEWNNVIEPQLDSDLNDSQHNALLNNYMKTGRVETDSIKNWAELASDKSRTWNTPEEEEPADTAGSAPLPVLPSKLPNFSNVKGGLTSTEEGSWLDTAKIQAGGLRDGLKELGARFLEQSERIPNVAATYDLMKMLTGGDGRDVTRGYAADIKESANKPENVAARTSLKARFEDEGGVSGYLGAGVADAVQSPSSVLSLIGGPAAAITIADAYAAAYEQGHNENLEGEQLEAWALSQAAPELVSFIPAGKVITKIPVIGPLIKDRVAKIAAKQLAQKVANPVIAGAVKTAQTIVGESTEEMFTGSLQDLAAAAFSGQERAVDLQRMGQKAMPQDEDGNFSWSEFGKNRSDEVRASVVMGGATGPINQATAYRDAKKETKRRDEEAIADTTTGEQRQADSVTATYTSERDRVRAEETTRQEQEAANAKATNDFLSAPLAEQPTGRGPGVKPRPVESFEAFAQREGERLEAEQQALAATQNEFNTAPTPDKLEGMGTAAQAKPVEPFEAYAEREAAVAEAANARTAATTDAAGRLVEANKKIEADKKRAESQLKSNETSRKNRLARQVATEHADKTPAEQATILSDLIADPAVAPVSQAKEATQKTPEEKVQSVINQVEGLRKSKSTSRENRRIRSLYRQDETRTAKDIADIIAADDGQGAIPEEGDIKAKVAALNKSRADLNEDGAVDAANTREQEAAQLSENGPVVKRTPEQQKSYVDRVRSVITSMGNTQETVDIRSLIKQGKLVLTDRAESVGREATTSRGTYSVDEGKMYIYLDNIDTKNPKSDILAAIASHESGHAGQFNQREGRDGLFKHLLGDKGNAAANQQIRDLAAGGHKLAKDVLDAAVRAAEQNNTTTNVENLELVPYLFSLSKENSPGRLGKVVRDVKVAAREATRKTLGKNLDYSIDELVAAADKVAGEIVKTDLKPGVNDIGDLNMIGGEKATGFAGAKSEGKTSTPKIDGKERFEFTDENAEMRTDDAAFAELDAGKTIPLSRILSHEEFAKQYPELSGNLKVKIDRNMPPGTDAQYVGGVISLAPSATSLSVNVEALKDTILHEVQHAVQEAEGFVAGNSASNLMPSAIVGARDFDKKRLATLTKEFELGAAVNGLNERDRAAWEQEKKDRKLPAVATATSRAMEINAFISGGYHTKTRDVKASRQAAKLKDVKATATQSAKDYRDAEDRAFRIYMADRGEAEARNTALRSRMTQEQRDANPAENTIGNDEGLTADQLLDTRQYIGKPQNAPVASTPKPSLDMAAAPYTAPAPRFNLAETVRRATETGVRRQVADNKLAEDYDIQLDEARTKDTGTNKLTDAMDEAMNDVMTSPLNNDPATRAQLWNNFAKTYPETAKVLAKIRDMIKAQDLDILNELVDPSRTMSAEERTQAGAVLANIETYMTRAFAAYQKGKKGSKWARLRWKNFEKFGELMDISGLSPRQQMDVQEVKDGIKALSSRVTVPDTDIMDQMSLDDLSGLLDRVAPDGNGANRTIWDFTDPDQAGAKRDGVVARLEHIRDNMPAGRVNELAQEMAHAMLGLAPKDTKWVKQFSELTRDPGTLKQRTRIPLAARRMLGEIETTPGAILSTIAAQAALKSRALAIGTLYRNELGSAVLTPEDYSKLSAKEQEKFSTANGPSWGRLEGLYIHKEVRDRLEETTSMFQTWGDIWKNADLAEGAKKFWDDTLPKYAGTANQYTKLTSVVGTPMTWLGNVGGSVFQLIDNGNYSPTSWVKGVRTSFDYIKSSYNDRTTPKLQEVLEFVNIESSDISDIQRVLSGKLEKYLDGTLSLAEAQSLLFRATTAPVRAGSRLKKVAVASYATMDNWTKLANFYHRYGVLKQVYSEAGDTRSNREIATQAGHDTSLTNISPERAGKWTKDLEARGLSMYLPYFYETFRTRVGGYQLAAADLALANRLRLDGKTKAANTLTLHATNRLVSHTLASAALPMFAFMRAFPVLSMLGAVGAVALSGADDDDKDKRRLLSDMNKDQTIMQVGKDKDGLPIYSNLSGKFDPFGPFTDLSRIMMSGGTAEERAKDMLTYVKDDLYIRPQFLTSLYNLIVPGARVPDSAVSQLLPAVAQAVESRGVSPLTVDKVGGVIDNFIPGVMKAWTPENGVDNLTETSPIVQAIADAMGADPKTALQIANKWGGARFETLDPEPRLKSFGMDSNDAKSLNNSDFNRAVLNNSGATTDEIVMNAAIKLATGELNRQSEAYKAVKALRAWKFPEDYVASATAEAFGKESAPSLLAGEADVAINLKGLLSYGESSGSFRGSVRRRALDDKTVATAKKIIELEPKLNAMGIRVNKDKMPKGWDQ